MKKLFFIMLVFLATASYADNKLGSVLINDSEAAISTLYNDGKEAVKTNGHESDKEMRVRPSLRNLNKGVV